MITKINFNCNIINILPSYEVGSYLFFVPCKEYNMSFLIWENGVTNSPNIRQNEKYSPKYSRIQQNTKRYKIQTKNSETQ